jgi:hypothetical protein
MWKHGNIKHGEFDFYWEIKVYDECSVFGIDGGRISKLCIKYEGFTMCCYDREWVMKPSSPIVVDVLRLILQQHNH